ncbi:MAG TPA: ABC transporter permease [Abditibacterium sp.]|jgi:simple sugar transport system permease protein
MSRFFNSAFRVSLPLVLALFFCALLIRVAGNDPFSAGAALWDGATGSRLRRAETLAKTIPLILTGLSVALAFRAGFFNIGAEGQFLLGAIAATFLGAKCAFAWPLVVLGGALAGAFWALIAGWLKFQRGASEIITTIMLNFIALQLVTFGVQGPLKERAGSQPQSDVLAPASQIPALIPGSNLHIGIFLVVFAAIASWIFLFRTVKGFEWRASGAGEKAARVAGIAVECNRYAAVACCGALAGMGGALEIAGATKQLNIGGFGYGYTAIAVALLANLNPLAVLPAALCFGALSAGGGAMERNAGVPAVAVSMIVGVLICALAAMQKNKSQNAT